MKTSSKRERKLYNVQKHCRKFLVGNIWADFREIEYRMLRAAALHNKLPPLENLYLHQRAFSAF